MTAPERIWAYSDGLWIEAWDAPPSGAEYIRADLAAVQPAHVRVKPLTDLVEEFTTAVWHLMDNSETSGPIDDPTITVWKPDFDEVSKLLDRIEGLPSGSTEHMGAGELLSANILAALEPHPDPRDEVIARLVDALRLMRSTYPYNPPCYGWEEQVEAHKTAKAALAAVKGDNRE